ncbi:CRISPR system precrRNA processing endoribonuclease RAMP protein Cas6 [Marinomonas mediterranea]|uniref:CRISPR system precrRNA processing endoribonuclease RAMP protein Cas6 n=1 Tax=Marinomonas mediterranea TaxID=119864 RepID=UPI002349D58C|nr:CRISPR system precrRNA processing endoribonuclease RAMP protein Cas6 [Marinomonas mediterranea]WCN08282.1 CRISPR system precrRNA processing endoribonuclease RAMP protein Cas6 [Marinomonas mediterranea]
MQLIRVIASLSRPFVMPEPMDGYALGGALHGVLESIVIDYDPTLAGHIGIAPRKQTHDIKHYSLIPPAFSRFEQPALPGNTLEFSVLLYLDRVECAEQLADLIRHHWQTFAMKGFEAQVVSVNTRILPISLETSDLSKTPPSDVSLIFQSPMLLDKKEQVRKQGELNAPDLLRVVRSIKRKICTLQPEAAKQLGMSLRHREQTPDWIAAEEAVRAITSQESVLEKVNWQYRSRTKANPVHFYGGMGRLTYCVQVPALIYQLLVWGVWFGIGQKTSLGQGMYRLE